MNTAPLDLVRERIATRLEEARSSAILSHLGIWLGVLDECQPWKAPDGLRQYSGVAEAAIVCASREDDGARRYFEEGIKWLQRRRFFVQNQPKSLEADPLACVALSAGVRAYGSAAAQQWLVKLVKQAIDSEQDRQRIDLFKLARAVAVGDDLTWNELSPILAVACAHKLQRRADPEQYVNTRSTKSRRSMGPMLNGQFSTSLHCALSSRWRRQLIWCSPRSTKLSNCSSESQRH